MSVRRYPCTIYGIHYESEYAAAKALGLNTGALRFRLRSPHYPECISPHHAKINVKLKKQPCTIDGVEYESECAAARAFGMRAPVLRNRLRSSSYPEYTSRYHPKEERRKRDVSCSVDGVEYASVNAASRKLGISNISLRKRLASPDFPEYVCADIPKKPPEPPRYTVRGKPYRTLQEIADEEGVTREWIRQKMKNPSCPDHISADIPKRPPPPPRYMVRGKPYRTLQEIAEAEGEQKAIIRQKIGSTLHPDYVSPRIAKKPPPSPRYMANGKQYKTMRGIAEAEGLAIDQVRQRLDNPSCLEYRRLHKRRI